MLLLTLTIKLLAEIALMALLGQGVLALLAGAGRERNPFYRVLAVVTGPLVRLTRGIAPRAVLDRHVPLVAFLLLGMVWLAATAFKVTLCVQAGVHTCR